MKIVTVLLTLALTLPFKNSIEILEYKNNCILYRESGKVYTTPDFKVLVELEAIKYKHVPSVKGTMGYILNKDYSKEYTLIDTDNSTKKEYPAGLSINNYIYDLINTGYTLLEYSTMEDNSIYYVLEKYPSKITVIQNNSIFLRVFKK